MLKISRNRHINYRLKGSQIYVPRNVATFNFFDGELY